jgi:hypothetical protein
MLSSGNTYMGARHLYWILTGPSFAVQYMNLCHFSHFTAFMNTSQIHERIISLRFLSISLRLEVSIYNVYVTN